MILCLHTSTKCALFLELASHPIFVLCFKRALQGLYGGRGGAVRLAVSDLPSNLAGEFFAESSLFWRKGQGGVQQRDRLFHYHLVGACITPSILCFRIPLFVGWLSLTFCAPVPVRWNEARCCGGGTGGRGRGGGDWRRQWGGRDVPSGA